MQTNSFYKHENEFSAGKGQPFLYSKKMAVLPPFAHLFQHSFTLYKFGGISLCLVDSSLI